VARGPPVSVLYRFQGVFLSHSSPSASRDRAAIYDRVGVAYCKSCSLWPLFCKSSPRTRGVEAYFVKAADRAIMHKAVKGVKAARPCGCAEFRRSAGTPAASAAGPRPRESRFRDADGIVGSGARFTPRSVIPVSGILPKRPLSIPQNCNEAGRRTRTTQHGRPPTWSHSAHCGECDP
jgi:hypothetical protein